MRADVILSLPSGTAIRNDRLCQVRAWYLRVHMHAYARTWLALYLPTAWPRLPSRSLNHNYRSRGSSLLHYRTSNTLESLMFLQLRGGSCFYVSPWRFYSAKTCVCLCPLPACAHHCRCRITMGRGTSKAKWTISPSAQVGPAVPSCCCASASEQVSTYHACSTFVRVLVYV